MGQDVTHLSSRQHRVLLGTLMGGSTLWLPSRALNPVLRMRGRDPGWMGYKIAELSGLGTPRMTFDGGSYRWHSRALPAFAALANSPLVRRSFTAEDLSGLYDLSWAVWFGDKGGVWQGKLVVSTTLMGSAGTHACADYFGGCGLGVQAKATRSGWCLLFGEEGTREAMQIAAPQFPPGFALPAVRPAFKA